MYTIDDSMLSLLLRFVGCNQEITFSNYEFMQKQLTTIQQHIAKFPLKEKQLRAVKWIEKYAQEYRKMWEDEIIDKELSNQRCPDCPLSGINVLEHCQIHDQWLKLLRQYISDEINSNKYVENTLKLLTQNKEKLKINLNMLKKMRRS